MANPQGNYSGYTGEHGAPSSAYNNYLYAVGTAPPDNTHQVRALWLTTAAVGLILYGVSFGSRTPLEWALWPAVLAATISAVGLAPRQRRHPWVVVSLAATGFAMALNIWIRTTDAGWALTTVLVLTILQTVVAAVALVLDREPAEAPSIESDYAAYTRYVQAYQTYAQQYQPATAPPPTAVMQGTANAVGAATAQADAQAASQAQSRTRIRRPAADSSQDSYSAMQARYTQHDAYSAAQPQPEQHHATSGTPTTSAGADPGIPSYGRGGAATTHQQEPHPDTYGQAPSS
ncbi:antigen 34 kDa [Mycolicibacterium fortuitum]|uniref:Antigen 34 kDa n=1 Tax=Mycolicibacterium fortuitum TaxID=1766 RepID=A0A378WF94_MYCFO|nr:antigen 34 kDa [Mycolicibacterium fortuitum]